MDSTRGHATDAFLLGLVLVLLKGFWVAQLVEFRLRPPMLALAYLVAIGIVVGRFLGEDRTSSLALGAGVGAGEVVLTYALDALAVEYSLPTGRLDVVIARGVLLGALVATTAVLARRSGPTWTTVEPVGTDAGGDPSASQDVVEADEIDPAETPDASGRLVTTPTFVVVLFGAVVVGSFWTMVLMATVEPLPGDNPLLFGLPSSGSEWLFAPIVGVVVAFVEGRRSRAGAAAVAGGVVAGLTVVDLFGTVVVSVLNEDTVVAVGLLVGTAAIGGAVVKRREASQRAAHQAAVVGTVLLLILVNGSVFLIAEGRLDPMTVVWSTVVSAALPALTGVAAYAAGAEFGPGRRRATTTGADRSETAVRRGLPGFALGAAVPAVPVLGRVGVILLVPLLAGTGGADVLGWESLTYLVITSEPLLLAVAIGAVAGITDRDLPSAWSSGALLGITTGVMVPLALLVAFVHTRSYLGVIEFELTYAIPTTMIQTMQVAIATASVSVAGHWYTR